MRLAIGDRMFMAVCAGALGDHCGGRGIARLPSGLANPHGAPGGDATPKSGSATVEATFRMLVVELGLSKARDLLNEVERRLGIS